MGFSKLELTDGIRGFLKEAKISTATDIQKRSIPHILKQNNVLAVAPTGSGKTLAFALPIMQKCKELESEFSYREQSQPLAIIISPTRELANQIYGELKKISYHEKLRVRFSTGAKVTKDYIKLVSSQYEVLVATPSRLKMAIDKGHLDLSYCQYCVLDEADQLFDMGFSKELGVVFHRLDKSCSLNLFSATMSEGILAFIEEKFSKVKWERVIVGRETIINKRIESYNIHGSEKDKPRLVKEMLKKNIKGRGIIFCNNKGSVEALFKEITGELPKLKIRILHGELHGKEREKTFKAFKEGKFQILLATDLAARGVDIKDLEWVINYQLPKSFIYYVHRSGRVARGSKTGIVYNFISSVDEKKIAKINEVIREQGNIDIALIKSQHKKKAKKAAKQEKPKRVKLTKRNKHLHKDASNKSKARKSRADDNRSKRRR